MLKKILCVAAMVLICGCSTSKNDAAVSSETAMNEQSDAGDVKSANAFELPYTFSLSGEKKADETIVTIQVEYKYILPEAPILTLTPHGDTVIKNVRLVSTLEMPENPGTVTKALILSGSDPGVDVSIEQKSEFMVVELHESWPPEKKTRDLETGPEMDDLPAQIEVEGTPIYRGVDVHP
ncbi:MAG: hypothetical protein IJU23_11465 [Proteobacteria bacterium]|nr:hypothetical protein [Pseudomonadota bacterium]